jgi:D-3-phosphoglycerate dehydrogenase
VPGIIGALGRTMGENGVNIANFTLGRSAPGADAIALLYVDAPIPAPVLTSLQGTGLFQSVRPLEFQVA